MSRKWTETELELLIELFPKNTTKSIVDSFPLRNYSKITKKASELGLKKTDEHILSIIQNPTQKTLATRYKPGAVPANKGKKMPEELKAKVKHTFFKKGNQPHNTKTAGVISERMDKRGIIYKWMKIADSDWRHWHRVIWEEHNGPIEKGNRIHFKDGNTLNCTIENLKCVTSQEAMDLNRITKYPQELQEVIKLKNKLKNKIQQHGTK